jgi:cyclic-di-GMP-binding protein
MPSFDVVSQVDLQELRNAVDQASREYVNRFDFRGTETTAEISGEEAVVVESSAEGRLEAANLVLKEKLIKRSIDPKAVSGGDIKPVGGSRYRSTWSLAQGIPQAEAKELTKLIRDSGLKVQAQVQGDQVRIQGKKRDDLQEAIALLKGLDFKLPLQYINFRD